VLEFLHRVLDVFVSYFGDVDEMVVKRNFSTVYQVCSVCVWHVLLCVHVCMCEHACVHLCLRTPLWW
jgi:hypothetical protein